MRRIGFRLLCSLSLFIALQPFLFAQTSPGDQKNVSADFRNLSDKRLELEAARQDAEQRVQQFTSESNNIAFDEQQIAAIKGKLPHDPSPAVKEVDLTNLQTYETMLAGNRKKDVVQADLKKAQEDLDKARKELTDTENAITRTLDIETPRQKFKTDLSIAFSILIGAVIIGFYFVAWRDPVVRASIFSGDAGLQFITLFALVIAIILFGMTEILQGRELSALLGGISGYILGRSATHAREKTQPAPEVNAPDPAADKSPEPNPAARSATQSNAS